MDERTKQVRSAKYKSDDRRDIAYTILKALAEQENVPLPNRVNKGAEFDEWQIKKLLEVETMSGKKWFHFSVASLLEGGVIGDAHFGEMDVHPTEDCDDSIRNLGRGLYDYPSSGGIWAGYVLAESREEAERIVQERM